MPKTVITTGVEHIRNNDTLLSKIIEKVGACEISPKKNHFHHILYAIIAQQLSMTVADTIRNRVFAFFDYDPTPEKISETSHDELRALGLSNAKVKSLHHLSSMIIEKEISLRGISKKGDEEIIAELTKVKGIGIWTAQMFLMFVLARPNVLPVQDLGIRKAIQKLYDLPMLPDEEAVRIIAEQNNWKPYCTVASWYLWRSLELPSE